MYVYIGRYQYIVKLIDNWPFLERRQSAGNYNNYIFKTKQNKTKQKKKNHNNKYCIDVYIGYVITRFPLKLKKI